MNGRWTCRCCETSTGGVAEYCPGCQSAGCTSFTERCT
ncbi:putative CxxC motif protein [Halorubrum virus Serpecor1]|uniref:Putative CxxC motif protein n=1 Tax=Halorubrum virus Serpecor1 TaxID=2721757 RepID=A0A6G9RW77_9CAUD|nr:putative CxxC motif protein [Halorubrum virus Serpecor1]QIR31237.1 putative CxxC motif protein [Halorubrum virus Serpecor1]